MPINRWHVSFHAADTEPSVYSVDATSARAAKHVVRALMAGQYGGVKVNGTPALIWLRSNREV